MIIITSTITITIFYHSLRAEPARRAGEMRTASGVAAGGGGLAAAGQREDRCWQRREDDARYRSVRPEHRGLSRETVAPPGPAHRAHTHDGQLRDQVGHGARLRHVAGERLRKTASGTNERGEPPSAFSTHKNA